MQLTPVNPIIPVTVIDNFFKDPDAVRQFALAQPFSLGSGHYPGYRSQKLDHINQGFEKEFTEQIFSTFFDFEHHDIIWSVESAFQSIPARFEQGWVHDDKTLDSRWNVAGIVYLSPNPEQNSGTSICTPNCEFSQPNIKELNDIKHQFYKGEQVDLDLYRHYRDSLNSKFNATITVENVYNRLMLYSANELHRANNFFGNTLEDSRLTLIFFAKLDSPNAVMPLAR